jgi:hypothetical protein
VALLHSELEDATPTYEHAKLLYLEELHVPESEREYLKLLSDTIVFDYLVDGMVVVSKYRCTALTCGSLHHIISHQITIETPHRIGSKEHYRHCCCGIPAWHFCMELRHARTAIRFCVVHMSGLVIQWIAGAFVDFPIVPSRC